MKVLIPIQDNEFGQAIMDMVLEHNWTKDSQFKLLTVVEYPGFGEMLEEMNERVDVRKIYNDRKRDAQLLLDSFASKLRSSVPGAMVDTVVAVGQAKNSILEESTNWPADIIVMGSHAKTGFSKFLLGSVSMSVLSHAPCSVIIVKQPQQKHRSVAKVASVSAQNA